MMIIMTMNIIVIIIIIIIITQLQSRTCTFPVLFDAILSLQDSLFKPYALKEPRWAFSLAEQNLGPSTHQPSV